MAKKLMKIGSAPQQIVSDPIVPLGSLAYMRPAYLAQSAWTEHIPFAFWLIEALRPSLFVELGTHWGLSYFAFCQAIDRLDLGAKAFAVDTWTGDEHSGKYGAEVFDGVRGYNDATYSHLSSLRKCRFDEAREYFLDGSIDLLHIDGLHRYEAVSHDLESWKPKMSRRGVVVFHDTNVREKEFGVFRLFDELKEKYPTFEFNHGHGLGIVGIGDEQTEKMRRLFDAGKDAELQSDLHTLFSGLGRACLDSFKVRDADELRKERSRSEAVEELMRHEISTLNQLLREAESNALRQSEELERAKREAEEKQAALADELRKEKSRSKGSEEQRRHEISDLTRLLKEAESGAAVQSEELKRARRETEKLAAVADELRREKSRSEANEGQRHREISILTRLLKEAESSGAGQSEDLKRARRAAEEAFERLGKRNVRGPNEIISGYASPAGLALGRAILQMIELPALWTILPHKAQLKRKVELLSQAGVFDAEWYLKQYDDVAKSGADPMEHYIKYGANEGRLPNGSL